MNEREVNWKYRFANFRWTFIQLDRSIKNEVLSDLERKELVLFFEVAFDLSLKTLNDYLKTEGFNPKSASEALEHGYRLNLIEDVNLWHEALHKDISSNKTYDEESIAEIEAAIRKYYRFLKQLHEKLQAEMPATL